MSVVGVLLIAAFTSVEDGASLVGTSQLLRVIEHLLTLANRALLLNDCFCVEIIRFELLNCRVLLPKD